MATLREKKKRTTRTTIIETALTLFRQKKFNETTMEEIARESIVSKATLYNYFEDKESILAAYFKNRISELEHSIIELIEATATFKEKLVHLIDFISAFFLEDQELTRIFFAYRMQQPLKMNIGQNELRSGIEEWFHKIIQQGQSQSELRKDIPAMMLTRNLQFLTLGYFITSYTDKNFIDFQAIKNSLVSMFLDGAKA